MGVSGQFDGQSKEIHPKYLKNEMAVQDFLFMGFTGEALPLP